MNTDLITINTHSSIRIGGSRILYFDPYQVAEPSGDADVILITHSHYDHFDRPSIENVAKKETVFVVPESMKNEMEETAAGREVIFMKPGEKKDVRGISVQAVPAYNSLKPFHPKRNGWLGYIAEMDGTKYYVAGDTDVQKELKGISCDVALLPIGGTYTMNAAQAAELANAIHPAAVIPTHYGSVVGSKKDADVFRSKVAEDIPVVLKL